MKQNDFWDEPETKADKRKVRRRTRPKVSGRSVFSLSALLRRAPRQGYKKIARRGREVR